MDDIKLVSGKSKGNGYDDRRERHYQAAPPQSRQARPAQAQPVRKAPKPKKQNSSGGRKAIIAAAIVLAAVFVGFAGLGVYANGLETIFPKVSMAGVDLGGMTSSEAADALTANNVGTDEDKQLTVTLPAGVDIS